MLLTLLILGLTKGYSCPDDCILPKCRCASQAAPIDNPPQFLLLTMDDSLQTPLLTIVNKILAFKNQNNCQVKATWFVQTTESNPYEVQKWYAAGNEVADHTVTHGKEVGQNMYAGNDLYIIQVTFLKFKA
jgi:hypothetical protein